MPSKFSLISYYKTTGKNLHHQTVLPKFFVLIIVRKLHNNNNKTVNVTYIYLIFFFPGQFLGCEEFHPWVVTFDSVNSPEQEFVLIISNSTSAVYTKEIDPKT